MNGWGCRLEIINMKRFRKFPFISFKYFKSRSHRVSPANGSKETGLVLVDDDNLRGQEGPTSDDSGNWGDDFDEYTMEISINVKILDITKLPPPKSPEFEGLFRQPYFQFLLNQSLTQCLIEVEDTIDSTLSDGREGLAPFMKSLDELRVEKGDDPGAYNGQLPIMTQTEQEWLVEILQFLSRPENSKCCPFNFHSKEKVMIIKSLIRAVKDVIKDRFITTRLTKRYLEKIDRTFSKKYPAGMAEASKWFKAFEVSGCSNISIPSSYKLDAESSAISVIHFAEDVYSVHEFQKGRESDGPPDLIPLEVSNIRSKGRIRDRIFLEAEHRLLRAHKILRDSFGRIHRPLRNQDGNYQTCVRLELWRLGKLLEYQRGPIAPSNLSTLLFFFKRILLKLNDLERILLTSRKKLKLLYKKVPEVRQVKKKDEELDVIETLETKLDKRRNLSAVTVVLPTYVETTEAGTPEQMSSSLEELFVLENSTGGDDIENFTEMECIRLGTQAQSTHSKINSNFSNFKILNMPETKIF